MSTQFAVDLVFKSQGVNKLDAATKKTKKLETAAKKASGQLDRAGKSGSKAGRQINSAFAKASTAAGRFQKKLGGLRSTLLGLGTGAALTKAFGDASQVESLTVRLDLLGKEYTQLAGLQNVAAQSADKFRLSNSEVLKSYIDLGNRLGEQGASVEDLQNIYDGLNTVLVKNRVSTQEAASATLQLNQALGAGRLAGEEFRAVNEAAPQVISEVAKVLGVARGEVKQLAADGLVSSQVLITALTNIKDKGAAGLEEQFTGSYGATREFNTALKEFSETVGAELLPVITPLLQEVTKLLEAFGKLPDPVKTASVAIAAVGAAALIAAPAIGTLLSGIASFAPAAIAAGGAAKLLAGGLVILKAAMLALPWVALAAGIAAATAAVVNHYQNQAKLRDLLNGQNQDLKALNDQIYNHRGELRKAEQRLDEMIQSGYEHEESIRAQKKEVERFRSELEQLVAQDYQVNIRVNYEAFLDKKDVNRENFSMDKVNAILQNSLPKPSSSSSSSRGGGGGGGGGAAPKTDDLESLNRQYEKLVQIAGIQDKINQAKLQGDQSLARQLEGEKALTEAKYAGLNAIEQLNTEEGKRVQELINQQNLEVIRVQTAQELLELEKQRKETLEGITQPLADEIELLQAKLNGNEEEIRQNQQILALKKQILAVDPNADTSGVAAMVKQRDELIKQGEAADALKQQYESLADSIAGSLTGAFKDVITGAKSAEEALANAFQSIADAFLDMALSMIQQWIKMQIMGIFSRGVSAAPGGVPGSGLAGGGSFFTKGLGWGSFGSFEGGGYTGDGPRSGGVDGRGGFPAILHSNETVVDHTSAAMSRYGPNNAGGAAVAAAAMEAEAGGASGAAGPMNITIEGGVMQIGGDEYVRKDQLPSIISQAGKAGETRALRKLQMSPTARRRVGM